MSVLVAATLPVVFALEGADVQMTQRGHAGDAASVNLIHAAVVATSLSSATRARCNEIEGLPTCSSGPWPGSMMWRRRWWWIDARIGLPGLQVLATMSLSLPGSLPGLQLLLANILCRSLSRQGRQKVQLLELFHGGWCTLK